MSSNYKSTLINLIKVLLIIFGGISIIVAILILVFGEGTFEKATVIYLIVFIISLTFFGLFTVILIDYLKKKRENRFFKKEPYSKLQKRTIEVRKVKKSKYDFEQIQRIIEINGERFAIEYYDDFFKLPISDVLLVFKESEPQNEPKVINYKKNNYSFNEILEIIGG